MIDSLSRKSSSSLSQERRIYPAENMHEDVRAKTVQYGAADLELLEKAMQEHEVVVVGMKQNPFVRGVRKHFAKEGIAFFYIEHGSYFSGYRRRLAYKMYTGWATFPMVFVRGQFIGGLENVRHLTENGELKKRLAAD